MDAACEHCEGQGQGCPDCDGSGDIEIPHCPKLLVDESVMELIRLAEHFDAGMPPVAGGVGDQTDSFLHAHRAYKAYGAKLEAEEQAGGTGGTGGEGK